MNPRNTLKKTLIGCLVLLATTVAKAQFKGGLDDGTHVGQGSNQPLGRNIFLGGGDDGISLGRATGQPLGRNIFLGGVDDGTSASLAANQPLGRNIFHGGVDDGISVSLAADQPIGGNIFLGGRDDGSSSGLAAAQPLGRSISLGGGNDGWAMVFLSKDTPPLPVTLVEFGGRWQQNDALLFWKTASEQHSSHFELERSFDGSAFASIQHIPAAGQSSSARSYQYTDVGINQHLPPGAAYVYYRLRSVDTDGTAAYSGVVVLQAAGNTKATGSSIEYAVFPNPAQDVVTVRASELPAGQAAYIRLVDSSGRVLLVQKMTANSQQLVVSAYANGIYFLQLVAAEKVVYTQRLLISK